MVVVLSNGEAGMKRVSAYAANATFADLTGHIGEPVVTDADGFAEFPAPAGSLSVWAC
jgi:alpha-amylase